MKKIMLLFFILSSLCFSSEYKYYEGLKIKDCVAKLNELKASYNILSYSLALECTGSIFPSLYTLIVEIEDKNIVNID